MRGKLAKKIRKAFPDSYIYRRHKHYYVHSLSGFEKQKFRDLVNSKIEVKP